MGQIERTDADAAMPLVQLAPRPPGKREGRGGGGTGESGRKAHASTEHTQAQAGSSHIRRTKSKQASGGGGSGAEGRKEGSEVVGGFCPRFYVSRPRIELGV